MFKNARPSALLLIANVIVAMTGLVLSPSTAMAQKFEIKNVAEKKIQHLPPGPLFWRVENFPRLLKRKPQQALLGLPPRWRARFGSSRSVRKANHL